jgi:DNA polymerase II small subunit
VSIQREIFNALSFAISKGYQIHPDAFAMLKGLDIDTLKIVQDIVKIKIKHKQSSSIVVEDIKNLINTEGKTTDVNSFSNTILSATTTITDANHATSSGHSYKVIFDPTPSINSGEGVKGYTALFRSRFEKLLRIIALRPDSKRIIKITSLRSEERRVGKEC